MRFGRYDLVERIGEGGMAEVFLGVQRGPRGVAKRLVIKRIAPARAADERFVALFEQEARIGCDLSHGNLVSVFEFGRVGDHWFIAMEHVDGCDLGAVLAAGRLPVEIAARIAADVCRGLAHVHARGYVHRDVTPRNVLLSWDGQVKLSDYGVALAGKSATCSVSGTPRYMAPEQARGAGVDARADLYAVGAILLDANATGVLAEIAQRATAPDPSARFASADEMREALERVAAGIDERAIAAAVAALRGSRAHVLVEHAQPSADQTKTGSSRLDPLAPIDALVPAARALPRRSPIRLIVAATCMLLVAAGAAFAYRRPSSTPSRPPARAAVCEYGEGYYCGSVLRKANATAAGWIEDNTLYLCADDRASVKEVCEYGCQVNAVGDADICRWREATASASMSQP